MDLQYAAGREVIRPKYAAYGTPSSEQKRTKKKAQGNKLYGHKQGPRMNSREESFAYALNFMFIEPKELKAMHGCFMEVVRDVKIII